MTNTIITILCDADWHWRCQMITRQIVVVIKNDHCIGFLFDLKLQVLFKFFLSSKICGSIKFIKKSSVSSSCSCLFAQDQELNVQNVQVTGLFKHSCSDTGTANFLSLFDLLSLSCVALLPFSSGVFNNSHQQCHCSGQC